jgi:glycosyltransferase involved in cell wall biosynthesis
MQRARDSAQRWSACFRNLRRGDNECDGLQEQPRMTRRYDIQSMGETVRGFGKAPEPLTIETRRAGDCLRIAMLSWESMHSIAVGGLAPHITELSGALARRGHEVHIFTRQGTGQSLYEYIDHVHYHRCPFAHSDDFLTYVYRMCDSFVWHYHEAEHFMGRPFDIVHGHDWLASRALARVKNELHRSSVFTIHSTEYGRCGNTDWEDPLSRRIRDLEWEGTYVADRVIAVSKTLGHEVHGCYQVPLDKVFAIYNGVDVTKYDAPVDVREVRRAHRLSMDEPLVFFAGRLAWQKGPDILLEAVPRLLDEHPQMKIVFAGDGDMRTRLEERAAHLKVSASTRFLGHRSGRELVGLFKSADMVCVPSRNEPFGIVILEAWSAGKPVVATRIGGPAEFVQDDYNGLTVNANAEHVGDGVGSMLSDVPRALEMGRNGRREAESRFSWDHAAVATERVYESIWNPGGGADALCLVNAKMEVAAMSAMQGSRKTGNADGSSSGNGSTAMLDSNAPTHEQIRERAYQIYLRRKGAPGDPTLDWLHAEQEIRKEMSAKAAGKTTAKTEAPAAPQPRESAPRGAVVGGPVSVPRAVASPSPRRKKTT